MIEGVGVPGPADAAPTPLLSSKSMRFFSFALALAVFTCLAGCSNSRATPVEAQFVSLTIESGGGRCDDRAGCSVTQSLNREPLEFRYYTGFPRILKAQIPLNSEDARVKELLAIGNQKSFREMVRTHSSHCPETFDAGLSVEIVTELWQARDDRAGGCGLPLGEMPMHPYARLYSLLNALQLEFIGEFPAPPKRGDCFISTDAAARCESIKTADECAALGGSWDPNRKCIDGKPL